MWLLEAIVSLWDSRPEKAVLFKKIISLVIYIFKGHIRAHMKGNEMLFEMIYIFCGLWVWFSVIQVKASKFTENVSLKRTESQEEIQTI